MRRTCKTAPSVPQGFTSYEEDCLSLPEEGMMLNADLPESFCSSVVVQLESNGAFKLLILGIEDTIIPDDTFCPLLDYYQATMTSGMTC